MALPAAPLYEDVAGGPPGGVAVWADTSDAMRIRLAAWRPDGPARGTVLLFPGRTEYIEKYGDAAREMARRGYATLAIDWRGQGLAPRLLDDRRIGHVNRFTDYQYDVAAMVEAATAMGLPRPWHLLAHSMGGCIGLRAVMRGLPVETCAFSGPMWGIALSPAMKPLAWVMAHAAPVLGLGTRLPPNASPDNYVQVQPFEGNFLTTDPDMYAMMQRQLAAYPDLGLGGPSLHWLREALSECRQLAARPSPDLPCCCFLGGNERIVDSGAIHARMAAWPNAALELIDGAEHEVLMETPATRARVFDRLAALFSGGQATATAV